jgi:hypothetical protein
VAWKDLFAVNAAVAVVCLKVARRKNVIAANLCGGDSHLKSVVELVPEMG